MALTHWEHCMGNMAWKILGTGSAVLAGLAATKAADQLWQKTGREKLDPTNPESPLWQALGYAALTGLAAGAARTFATRKAAQYYARSSGHLPHEFEDKNA